MSIVGTPRNFVAIAVVSLSLYAPAAECGEEAEGSATAECEPKPPWYTEEARVIRQEGTIAGPWCVEEKVPARSQRQIDPIVATISATTIGSTPGIVGGYIITVAACFSNEGGGLSGYDCIGNPVGYIGGLLGGLASGYYGYQNNRAVVTAGGGLSALALGYALWPSLSTDGEYTPLFFVPGAYLGHRLWKAREAQAKPYALSPYLHDEGSGLVLAGRF